MGGKIKVLSDKVISQIAAGEVIERPASVVKELLENSIDAKASQIRILIEDGGKKGITVIDDGEGMEKEDCECAFFRHSTSKIATLRDLESITSLGFRGEALASIAAVSKATLRSKPRNTKAKAGCEICIEGGKIRHIRDAAVKEGTTIIVKDIFYNTPARRKYLKSQRVELAKITDIVTRQALIHPEIYFKLEHNGTEIINTPKASNDVDNIAFIYGKEIARNMLKLEYEDHDVKIKGTISKPGQTRKSSWYISVFVNKRYITSKLLNSAILEGYHNLIMKNRYPVAVISMEISPRKIDVNVHPSKLEIRFEDEKKVYDSFVAAIKNALETQSLVPQVDSVKLESPGIESFALSKLEEGAALKEMSPVIEAQRQVNIDEFHKGLELDIYPEPSFDEKTTHLPKMTLIGQILNTYIIAQSGENILIIDQHAASERVLFERLAQIQEEDTKKRQELLSPLTVELTPKQKEFVVKNNDILESLGFRMEPFGGNTYQIRAVPVVFSASESEKIVYDIIDDLLLIGKTTHEDEIRKKAMAILACHSAIRGGDELSLAQMKNLMESLYRTKNAYACPHGRPSILSMSKDELEKLFKRK